MTHLHIFTTGGTIDKVYFDALSEFQVGETAIDSILREANVGLEYELTPLMRKDSLELTASDRAVLHTAISATKSKHVLVTHGTDTMAQTAEHLMDIKDKTIVLTGAMQPARLRSTDAIFNIGFALAAAQLLSAGIYIAMNGKVFPAGKVRKDRAAGQFISD